MCPGRVATRKPLVPSSKSCKEAYLPFGVSRELTAFCRRLFGNLITWKVSRLARSLLLFFFRFLFHLRIATIPHLTSQSSTTAMRRQTIGGFLEDYTSSEDSVATNSTILSEHDPEKEFPVENILYEDDTPEGVRYLVKWAGKSFSSPFTLVFRASSNHYSFN